MKALVVSLSMPFIGRQRSMEARNIPTIEYEQTKARKGSRRSPFIGINRYEAFAEENVPNRKIDARPRSSSDVNMANQTKHSDPTWAHHQGNIILNAVA